MGEIKGLNDYIKDIENELIDLWLEEDLKKLKKAFESNEFKDDLKYLKELKEKIESQKWKWSEIYNKLNNFANNLKFNINSQEQTEEEKRKTDIEIIWEIWEFKQDVIRSAYEYYSTIKHKKKAMDSNYQLKLKDSYKEIDSMYYDIDEIMQWIMNNGWSQRAFFSFNNNENPTLKEYLDKNKKITEFDNSIWLAGRIKIYWEEYKFDINSINMKYWQVDGEVEINWKTYNFDEIESWQNEMFEIKWNTIQITEKGKKNKLEEIIEENVKTNNIESFKKIPIKTLREVVRIFKEYKCKENGWKYEIDKSKGIDGSNFHETIKYQTFNHFSTEKQKDTFLLFILNNNTNLSGSWTIEDLLNNIHKKNLGNYKWWKDWEFEKLLQKSVTEIRCIKNGKREIDLSKTNINLDDLSVWQKWICNSWEIIVEKEDDKKIVKYYNNGTTWKDSKKIQDRSGNEIEIIILVPEVIKHNCESGWKVDNILWSRNFKYSNEKFKIWRAIALWNMWELIPEWDNSWVKSITYKANEWFSWEAKFNITDNEWTYYTLIIDVEKNPLQITEWLSIEDINYAIESASPQNPSSIFENSDIWPNDGLRLSLEMLRLITANQDKFIFKNGSLLAELIKDKPEILNQVFDDWSDWDKDNDMENIYIDYNWAILFREIFEKDYDFDGRWDNHDDSRTDFVLRVMDILKDYWVRLDPDTNYLDDEWDLTTWAWRNWNFDKNIAYDWENYKWELEPLDPDDDRLNILSKIKSHYSWREIRNDGTIEINEDYIKTRLKKLEKEIGTVFAVDSNEEDYKRLNQHLIKVQNALENIKNNDTYTWKKIEENWIFLCINDNDYRRIQDSQDWSIKFITVDYDEDIDEIIEDITEAAEDL